MGTKRRILLPTISGIAAGSAAGTVGMFNLPRGYRYHSVEIVYVDSAITTLTPLTLFDDIVVYKNTKAQRIHSAAELDHLNNINGSQYSFKCPGTIPITGTNSRQTLPIFFAEPWRKDKVDSDFLAWNVDQSWGWNTFQISVKLLAALPATGSIIAYAYVDDVLPVVNNGAQPIKKVYRQSLPASGTSIDVTTLDQADAYQTICMKHPSTGYITEVSLKRNGQLIYEQVGRAENYAALIQKGLVPADSITVSTFGYDLVLDWDDAVNSALVAQGQAIWMQLKFSAAAAGNVVALIERLGNFDN